MINEIKISHDDADIDNDADVNDDDMMLCMYLEPRNVTM
jgi:hypothetical protein